MVGVYPDYYLDVGIFLDNLIEIAKHLFGLCNIMGFAGQMYTQKQSIVMC
jgi:hypothetical protein